MSEKYVIDHDWGFGTEFESKEDFFEAWGEHLREKQESDPAQADRFAPDVGNSP